MNLLLLEQVKCGDTTEYAVTLVTGQTDDEDSHYVEGVEKTRTFATEEESIRCFEQLRPIAKYTPYAALKRFNRYCNPNRIKMDMSQCLGPTKILQHRVTRPDGTISVWKAVVSGGEIAYPGTDGLAFFPTLGAFASAHYKCEHPTRKSGNGWDECETLVYGEWVKMSVMREIRV